MNRTGRILDIADAVILSESACVAGAEVLGVDGTR